MAARIIEDEAVWDRFVESSPYGTLFHRWKFLKIMEKYSGYTLMPYGIYRSEELSCVFPLFYKYEKGLKIVASPPRQSILYVPYLGFVMSREYDRLKQHKKEHFLDEVFQDIDKEISRLSPNYVSIVPVPESLDFRPFMWSGYTVDMGYTYMIDLKQSEQDLWNNLTKSCRKDIKEWERRALTMKPEHDVERFFQIMKSNLTGEGPTFFHNQSPQYVKEIMEAFPDNVKMLSMCEGDTPRQLAVNIIYRDKALMWMSGKPDEKDSCGEYFIWKIIQDARKQGALTIENWGTGQKRLCQYKSKFNPSLEITCAIRKQDNLAKLAAWTYTSITQVPVLGSIIRV